MIEAKALFVFAGIVAVCILILIGDWIRRLYINWRERRDMRIRDDRHRWELLQPYEPRARKKRL